MSIENDFKFHPASPSKGELHSEVRLRCEEVASYFEANIPAGREAALAKTKLEEAMFWANAAVARSK